MFRRRNCYFSHEAIMTHIIHNDYPERLCCCCRYSRTFMNSNIRRIHTFTPQ
uniref:PDZ domain-containing protein n=1 Tax=Parascaris univalens TaxID=6257 RepID=A0A915BWK7_PARUN